MEEVKRSKSNIGKVPPMFPNTGPSAKIQDKRGSSQMHIAKKLKPIAPISSQLMTTQALTANPSMTGLNNTFG